MERSSRLKSTPSRRASEHEQAAEDEQRSEPGDRAGALVQDDDAERRRGQRLGQRERRDVRCRQVPQAAGELSARR